MGRDIHFVIEMRDPESHVFIGQVYSKHLPITSVVRRRNHWFFDALMRETNFQTYPFPYFYDFNISDLSRYWVEHWGEDGHSYGCISLDRFVELYYQSVTRIGPVEEYDRIFHIFGFDTDIPENAEYRVVFWFDN